MNRGRWAKFGKFIAVLLGIGLILEAQHVETLVAVYIMILLIDIRSML